jgi:hypothetical protein
MNKAKRLGVLALAGLVILSVLASTSIANGAKSYYVRGPSGELTERVADINMTYTPTMQPWNFSEGATTPQGWYLNGGDSIMDNVRYYMNDSTFGWQSQNKGYFVFPPGNATGHNVTDLPDTFGWDNSGYGMMDNVRWYLNNQASGDNLMNFGEWRIFK